MSRSVALCEELASGIARGEPPAGAELPALRALARERGLAVATVARAYERLARAGVITVTPRSRARVAPGGARAAARLLAPGRVRLAGSDDPALDLLLSDSATAVDLVGAPGSLGGLAALWRNSADAAALHLATADGEYNAPFARRLLAGRDPLLVRLWRREQGLLVAPGNPEKVRCLSDVLRLRVAMRPPGTGTRALLERELHAAGGDAAGLSGPEARSHLDAALAVASGQADAALGVRAAAALAGVDFLTLCWEPFDLALPAAALPAVESFLGELDRSRARIEALGGYDLSRAGEVVALGA